MKHILTIIFFSLLIFSCQKEKNDGSLELTFWHAYPPEKEAVLDEMIALYQKENPEVSIIPRFISTGEEMLKVVQSSFLSGDFPDIMWGFPTWTGVLESTGRLMELDSRLPQEFKDDIIQGLWDAGSFNDKTYSVPIEAGTLYLIYNQDMFAEQGLEQAPADWEELYEYAEALTQDDRYGIWLPVGPTERTTWTWLVFLWQNGGTILNDAQDNLLLDSPEAKEALEFYGSFYKNNISLKDSAFVGSGQDPFVDEKIAMVIGTQGAANAYVNKFDMNVGVAPIPYSKEEVAGLGSNHLFLFSSDEEKENATLDFVQWLLSGEQNAKWAIDLSYLPVSISAQNSQFYKDSLSYTNKVAAEVLLTGRARPTITAYPRISSAISENIEALAYDKVSIDEAIASIQKQGNEALQDQ